MVRAGHPGLASVWFRYQTMIDETCDSRVGEVSRTIQKQRDYVRRGASKTMRSRHIPEKNRCGKACAIDLWAMHDLDEDGDLDISWVMKHYKPIADKMKEASIAEGNPEDWLQWGVDLWGWDGPHLQINPKYEPWA